jgi:hypothetical protein
MNGAISIAPELIIPLSPVRLHRLDASRSEAAIPVGIGQEFASSGHPIAEFVIGDEAWAIATLERLFHYGAACLEILGSRVMGKVDFSHIPRVHLI